jgi:hypothetical protein
MNANTCIQERKTDNELPKKMSDILEEEMEECEEETEEDRQEARNRGQSVQSLIHVFVVVIMDASGLKCSMPIFYKYQSTS